MNSEKGTYDRGGKRDSRLSVKKKEKPEGIKIKYKQKHSGQREEQ